MKKGKREGGFLSPGQCAVPLGHAGRPSTCKLRRWVWSSLGAGGGVPSFRLRRCRYPGGGGCPGRRLLSCRGEAQPGSQGAGVSRRRGSLTRCPSEARQVHTEV